MRNFFSYLFRLFFTGLATIMPLVVTVLVLGWIVRLADSYIGPSSSFGLFLVTVITGIPPYAGYVVGYAVLATLLILLGFLVTRATVKRLRSGFDSALARIPLVGKIYTAVGQVVELLGQKNEGGLDKFGGVVQIRLGNINAIALLTSQERYRLPNGKEHIMVFVPNSPLPATGFNLLVPVEDVCRLDLPVEDLVKLCMSLGLLAPQILAKPMSNMISCEVGNDEGEPASNTEKELP